MQFFDRMIPLLSKKPNLLDKVITMEEGMDKVKDLLRNFIGKQAVIQSKMKLLTSGFYSLILSFLDSNDKIKDFNKWSSSFDHIVGFPQVASIFQDDIVFYELIETLLKI